MASFHEQVSELLEKFRPAIQADGGDIELVETNETSGQVHIRLLGACIDCPSSHITLKSGIERTLKERIPSVSEVVQVQ